MIANPAWVASGAIQTGWAREFLGPARCEQVGAGFRFRPVVFVATIALGLGRRRRRDEVRFAGMSGASPAFARRSLSWRERERSVSGRLIKSFPRIPSRPEICVAFARDAGAEGLIGCARRRSWADCFLLRCEQFQDDRGRCPRLFDQHQFHSCPAWRSRWWRRPYLRFSATLMIRLARKGCGIRRGPASH
jgi:hypothetical protein